MIETTYAKLLVGKRREFIERGPWTLEQVRDGVREVTLERVVAGSVHALPQNIKVSLAC
jgi:hypothetical protein